MPDRRDHRLQARLRRGELFREGLFQFMTSFSLPWYAIAGAQSAVTAGLPVIGILVIAVIGPTAGRYYIDITCGVAPKQFIRGEWFVPIALLTGPVWLVCFAAGLGTWASAGISFAVGFTLRVIALYRAARTQAQGQVSTGDEGPRAQVNEPGGTEE